MYKPAVDLASLSDVVLLISGQWLQRFIQYVCGYVYVCMHDQQASRVMTFWPTKASIARGNVIWPEMASRLYFSSVLTVVLTGQESLVTLAQDLM